MSDALAAALMATQRKQYDPAENSRKYGQMLLQQGSSTAPVQSPLEGLARALTGGVGGFFEGQAERQQEGKQKETLGGLADLLSGDPATRAAGLERLKGGDPSIAGPVMAGMIGDQRKTQAQSAAGDQFAAAYGMPKPGAQPQSMPGQSAAVPPLPQGQPTTSGFNNNLGNIRATPINWDGKGAPHNGFETFGTPDQGAGAMVKNLGAYVKANPNVTVAQAIAKWAPPNENNTDLYIRQVAEGTGINPAAPLAEVLQDPAMAAQLLDAITRKEKGGLPQGVNADTFMKATTPGGLTIGIPQGSAEQQTQQPAPATPAPQAPAIPDVPRPQPNPQTVERLKGAIASGEMTPNQAVSALQQEVDRDWNVARDRAKMQFEQETHAFREGQKAPQQRVENAGKLRDDFQASPIVKSYREVQPIMASMDEALRRPTKAADLNLIYGLGKIMDPNSVVREGELALAKSTGTLGDELKSLYSKVNGGSGMSQETREKLVREARSRFGQLQTQYDSYKGQFKQVAERGGLDPRDVIVEGMSSVGPAVSPNQGVLDEARDAIAKGAPKDKVIERLRAQGVDPGAL